MGTSGPPNWTPTVPATRTVPVRKAPAGLSQKEQRRLAELEAQIAAKEAELAGLDAALVDPQAFLRADSPGHQALRQREAALAALGLLEDEWLALEERRCGV